MKLMHHIQRQKPVYHEPWIQWPVERTYERSGAHEQSEQCGASEWVSGASERVSEGAICPILYASIIQSSFLTSINTIYLDRSDFLVNQLAYRKRGYFLMGDFIMLIWEQKKVCFPSRSKNMKKKKKKTHLMGKNVVALGCEDEARQWTPKNLDCF